VRLESAARAPLDQQRLEHVLDPLRRPDQALDARAPATAGDDRKIARACFARAFAVNDDRDAGVEVRLADQELAAPSELDDNGI
jgi:hypothetical protein